MKKLLLLISSVLIVLSMFAQQVEREMVDLEIGTGTWCVWCPGAAWSADELVNNGKDVAVIENHNGDAFANQYSNARNSYNSVGGYPTAKFDGVETYEGGWQCPNPGSGPVYAEYLALYNLRKAIPSSFTIDMMGSHTGLNYDVTLTIHKVAAASTSNCVVQLFLTESEIQTTWFCMTECNFVNRLMVPNENGTTLNLSNDQQVINLSFSLNPSWNEEHCELVALIQNNSTHEVYQCIKLALEDLTPAPVLADFTSDINLVCEAGTVHFTDNSEGNITQRQWTFPGGTPNISTQANPSVVYNTEGTYDVTLWVTDGFTTDEVTKPAYITVSAQAPGTPGTPEGETMLCKNPPNGTYSVEPVPYAVQYDWEITPSTAGLIMNDGNSTITVNFVNAYVGTASLKVKAINGCGESDFSDELGITISNYPDKFNVTGGGIFCEEEEGVEVGLDGSVVGVDYELYKDGEPTGNIITGTGEAISFGLVTETGIYSAFGTDQTTTCSILMDNTAEVVMVLKPTVYYVNGGGAYCDGTNGVEVGLDGSETGCNYELYFDEEPTGIVVEGTGEPISFGMLTDEGSYSAIATETVASCVNIMEGTAEVTIIPLAETPPVPEGPVYVDLYYTETSQYETSGSANSTSYDWNLEPADAGTVDVISVYESEVTWNTDYLGTATVKVRGMNECGPSDWSEALEITVDNTVGLNKLNDYLGIRISPNPTDGIFTLYMKSEKVKKISIKVVNSLNAVIYSSGNVEVDGSFKDVIDLGFAQSGIYFLFIETAESTFVKKLIIQ